MAWANKLLQPSSINMNLKWSDSLGPLQDFVITFSPKNPDGTPYDCTPVTAAACLMQNGAQWVNTKVTGVPSVAVDAAGPTGVTLRLTAVTIANFVTTLVQANQLSGQVQFSLSDGTSSVLGASGAYSISMVP